MMTLFQFKVISAIVILFVAVIAGWVPFRRRIVSQQGHDFPVGEALASGIFLGAGLIHMLPDAASGFAAAGYHYPIAFLLCGVSFLLLLLLEHFGREMRAHNHQGGENAATGFALLAVLMLSIHSLLAGAALGLSESFAATIIVLVAILAHKWAASFALSVQINKSALTTRQGMFYFALFAVMAPLGVIVSSDAVSSLSSHALATPIFNALAAGTFLYIGTLHGLNRAAMIQRCCNLKEFMYMIAGFVLMAVVAIWA